MAQQLKHEAVAEIGDTIKAFDHQPIPGRPDRFVIGRVLAKGPVIGSGGERFNAYTVRVLNDSHETYPGEHVRVGLLVYVPFEVSILEYEGRVSKVAA